MKIGKLFHATVVGMAVVGACLPQSIAAETATPAPKTTDIALMEDGVLLGQIVDTQGKPVVGAPVSLRYQDKELVTTKSGKEGVFAIKGVRGGVYQVATTDGQGVFRAWTANTAPPAAQQSALVVSGSNVVRGQNGTPSGPRSFLANPVVIAGVVATAVAVPVAVHQAHLQKRPPASL
jgi:hypothetical protein